VEKRRIVAQFAERGEVEREFDRRFWREAGPEARFAAMWQAVIDADLIRGGDGQQPRLQRSVGVLVERER
jgi:hypothetical protein